MSSQQRPLHHDQHDPSLFFRSYVFIKFLFFIYITLDNSAVYWLKKGTVHIGGVNERLTKDLIRHFFSRFGVVTGVTLRPNDHCSTYDAFITFENSSMAQRAHAAKAVVYLNY